jgi:hypothetical protein
MLLGAKDVIYLIKEIQYIDHYVAETRAANEEG